MSGCDAVIHLAGTYTIGIPASERPAMYEANVALTERVLDAAISLGIPRIVTASTCQRLRQHPRPDRRREVPARPGDGFLSYYDETKYRAHVAAKARISAGAPIVIVMPGTIYGADDHSAVGGAASSAIYHGRAHYVALGDVRALADVRGRSREWGRRGDRTGSPGRELRPGRREHAPSRRDPDRRPCRRSTPAAPQPPDQPAAPVCRGSHRTADG